MKPLSLESINATSFYNVELSEREGFYQFFTDYGVHYAIGFVKSDLLINDEVYELMIANLNNQSSKRDSHVREAIIAIIDDFFEQNNDTLLYICETGDNKQAGRSRLFEYWFSMYSKKALFTMLSTTIVDSDGVSNFATIITRNDNPNYVDIISEFTETVQLLSNKPD